MSNDYTEFIPREDDTEVLLQVLSGLRCSYKPSEDPKRYLSGYRTTYPFILCTILIGKMARLEGLEPSTLGLAYQLPLSRPQPLLSLWSGLSLRRLRRRTYSLYGSP